MPVIEMRIPQLGEGLQEARIVRHLKRPGDRVVRDEPVYEMETDKAVTQVESPVTGVLESWIANENDILPIGDPVARILTDDVAGDHPIVPDAASATVSKAVQSSSSPERRARNIPPRTRAYAKQKGIDDAELAAIVSAGARLIPGDIDRHIAARDAAQAEQDQLPEYEDVPMSARQRTLFYRLTRAQQQVVPGTIEIEVPWEPVERAHKWFEAQPIPEDRKPSRFLLVAWCVAGALAKHPKFRSTVMDVNTLRCYRHANLGIAVALPDDELATAVVSRADALSFDQFVLTTRAQIARARRGEDQANETAIHVALSSMEAFGLFTAVPVVVPPSVATIFLGAHHLVLKGHDAGAPQYHEVAHVTMTFDHRVINGVGAANFLLEVSARVAALPQEFPG